MKNELIENEKVENYTLPSEDGEVVKEDSSIVGRQCLQEKGKEP